MTNSKINSARLILGGLVASIILFAMGGIVNGAMPSQDFQTWSASMGNLIEHNSLSHAMVLWIVMDLIQGISGVWIYAAIRPRFGAGPKTALRAGLILWIVSKLAVALDILALGVLPHKIVHGQLIGSLVGILIAVLVGAWLYKE
jgi:hypothetical protein